MTRRRYRTVFGQAVFWVWLLGVLGVVWAWTAVTR